MKSNEKQRHHSSTRKMRCYEPVSKTFWWVHLKGINQGYYRPDESCKYVFMRLNAVFIFSKIPLVLVQKEVFG